MKILIYSNIRIEGLIGRYQNPKYFSEIDKTVELVYTDLDEIKKAYESVDVEVKPISKVEAKKPKQTKKKKED